MQRELTTGTAFERIGKMGRTAPRTVRQDDEHELYPRGIMASMRSAWHASRSAEDLHDLAAHREAGRATGARF